jgi:hypothetical protein
VRHQHKAIRCHHLRDGASLYLVEGETNWNAPLIKPASRREGVPQRRDGAIRVAVLDQQPRLLARCLGDERIVNFLGALDGVDDLVLGPGGHAAPSK